MEPDANRPQPSRPQPQPERGGRDRMQPRDGRRDGPGRENRESRPGAGRHDPRNERRDPRASEQRGGRGPGPHGGRPQGAPGAPAARPPHVSAGGASAGPRPERRDPTVPPIQVASVKGGVPHGAREGGWLPDLVYTGEKFESGLAFFADAQGRITRFSREPADLAAARRLAGQAALPGLVNGHSHAWMRALRGRTELRAKSGDAQTAWRDAIAFAAVRLGADDVFETARVAFLEMLLSGITCVGEFHFLHHQPDGAAWPEPTQLAREVLRAAHDVGIRIALVQVAYARGDFRGEPATAPARYRMGSAEQFIRETEALRLYVGKEYAADEVWLGAGVHALAHVPLEATKTVAAFARAQRFRFHVQVSATLAENEACRAEYGRTPIALLAEYGIVDKRFTAVDAQHISDDEIRLLGSARASVCLSPTSGQNLGLGMAPVEKLLAASAGVALGTDTNLHIDLLKDARALEYSLRVAKQQRGAVAADAATALFHAATVAGARSLGATSGALEVGRPADFFTVNLFDPSVAGADPETLLASVVYGLDRRAIRDVWVGARQRIASGRHVNHGAIVGRFVEAQKRVWGGEIPAAGARPDAAAG